MQLKDHHKTHLGNTVLFVVLLGLFALPFAGIEFVRYESIYNNGTVLSEQDSNVEEDDDTSLPHGKFIKYEGKVLGSDTIVEGINDEENEESTDSAEFDPVNYAPANIVAPR